MAGPKPPNGGCGPAPLTPVFRSERSALRQRPRREDSIVAVASYPAPGFSPEAVISKTSSFGQSLFDVRNDVIGMFDADGEAHIARSHPRCGLIFS